jgi:hypothetical protein
MRAIALSRPNIWRLINWLRFWTVDRGCVVTERLSVRVAGMFRAVVIDVGECLVEETREYGSGADWLGVPRHTFLAMCGADGDPPEQWGVLFVRDARGRRWTLYSPDHGLHRDVRPDRARPGDHLRGLRREVPRLALWLAGLSAFCGNPPAGSHRTRSDGAIRG